MDFLELGFRTQDEWSNFFSQWRPRLEAMRDDAVQRIAEQGLNDPYLGPTAPDQIDFNRENLRESLVAHASNSRTRAVLHVLRTYACGREETLDVYASESLSPFAERLRAHFPRFVGSEYLPTAEDRSAHPNLMHQDIQNFSFKDESFDAYVSCEVLEHVPDLDAALKEAARILKPGGLFVGTVPFHMGSPTRIQRAKLGPNGVEHLMEPEYHGNPTRPDEDSLVFAIPGWDFVQDLTDAGFEDASMRLIMSAYHGLLTNDVCGVFVFTALKPQAASR